MGIIELSEYQYQQISKALNSRRLTVIVPLPTDEDHNELHETLAIRCMEMRQLAQYGFMIDASVLHKRAIARYKARRGRVYQVWMLTPTGLALFGGPEPKYLN